MNEPNWNVAFVLGLIIVAAVSYSRFKGPSWIRSYTTAFRFYSGLVIYLLSQALILYVVSAGILSVESYFMILVGESLSFSQIAVLTPIVIGILLAWVVPHVPGIRRFVRWQLQICRRIAGSPTEAYILSRQLMRADFAPDSEFESTVRSILERRGWDTNADWLPVAEPVQARWFKTSLLFQIIRQWESDPRYSSFVEDVRIEFDILRKRYDQLSMKVVRTFQMIEGFGSILAELHQAPDAAEDSEGRRTSPPRRKTTSDSKLRTSITDMLSDIRTDVEFLGDNICLMIARGVLSKEKTANGRRRSIRKLGFSLDKQPAATRGVLLLAFTVVVCVLFLTFAVLGTGSSSGNFPRMASMIVMIATIQVVGLAVAIVPKEHMGFANIDIHGRTPKKFVLLAGVTTFVLALPVSLLFKTFIFLDWSQAFADLVAKMPWLVMPCFTAMATAYLIQDNRWHATRSAFLRRIKDAIFMGAALSVGIVVVVWLFTLFPVERMPGYDRIPSGLILGLLIGYVVPHAFRDPAYLDDQQLDQLKELERRIPKRGRHQDQAVAAT